MPTLHLFGGGDALLLAMRVAREHGWAIVIRTSSRYRDFVDAAEGEVRAQDVTVHVDDRLGAVMRQGSEPAPGDVALSFGAPWLFPGDWIERWGGRAFNVHARRLPEHRGAGGNSWQILMGETSGRVSVHLLTTGIDDGPVVASLDFDYAPPHTAASYAQQDVDHTGVLLRERLPALLDGSYELRPQDHARSTYWPRLHTDVHGWIDWSWHARHIASFVAAFGAPYPGASTYLRQQRVRIREATWAADERFHPFQSGLVFRVDAGRLHVAAVGGELALTIEPEPERAARPGDRLVTPADVLERARASRVGLLPDGTWRVESALPDDGV